MARVVRKVSTKSIKGQKKDSKLSTKLKVIIAASVACVIAVITLIVVLVQVNSNSNNQSSQYVDYLTYQTYDDYKNGNKGLKYNGKEVNFNKMNYSGVLYHHNNYVNNEDSDDYYKYVLVCAMDFNAFFPDDTREVVEEYTGTGTNYDQYDESHKIFRERLMMLQLEVDEYNTRASDDEKAILYLVDTSNNINIAILADSRFTNSEEESSSEMLFCVLAGGMEDGNDLGLIKYDFSTTDDSTNKNINNLLCKSIATFNSTTFNKTVELLDNDFKNYINGVIEVK